MEFQHHLFSELNIQQLYDILQLRSEVFVVEQNCVYQDIDGHDQEAIHILSYDHDTLVAYARILPSGSYFKQISIGRIIVKESHRGIQLGHKLMEFCLSFIFENSGQQTIKISAQEHLKSFYEQHGFIQSGKGYLEDGIPHIAMLRS